MSIVEGVGLKWNEEVFSGSKLPVNDNHAIHTARYVPEKPTRAEDGEDESRWIEDNQELLALYRRLVVLRLSRTGE